MTREYQKKFQGHSGHFATTARLGLIIVWRSLERTATGTACLPWKAESRNRLSFLGEPFRHLTVEISRIFPRDSWVLRPSESWEPDPRLPRRSKERGFCVFAFQFELLCGLKDLGSSCFASSGSGSSSWAEDVQAGLQAAYPSCAVLDCFSVLWGSVLLSSSSEVASWVL